MSHRVVVLAVGALLSACGVASIGGATPALLGACGAGAVVADCLCGGTQVSSGYCCDGAHQSRACIAMLTCAEGEIGAVCLCGDTSYSTGYCCGGQHQPTPCTPPCEQGEITGTCDCGGATYGGGYCCDGGYQAGACACDEGAVTTTCSCGSTTVTSGSCCSGTPYSTSSCPRQCAQGQIPSGSSCLCGGTLYSSGYCCSGQRQTTSCTPSCGQGQITQACVCAGTTRTSGYCCGGGYQTVPCACAQGTVTTTCSCGSTTVSSGSCCGGTPYSTSSCPQQCAQGQIPSGSSCLCGGSLFSSGYCCSGQHQTTSCTPSCGQGQITQACVCAGATRTSGYCCGGSYQTGACACAQGTVTTTCSCGSTTVSSGSCCGGTPYATSSCPQQCAQGQISSGSSCLCGGTLYSSGYCCSGSHRTDACPTSSGLIVDHRAAMAFSTIPPEWLEAAKLLTFHFAHTSHGSQINTGLWQFEQQDSRYSVRIHENHAEELPTAETPPALRIYDGNGLAGANGEPDTVYITPELYWNDTVGLTATNRVAASGHYDFSMWSWCGQAGEGQPDSYYQRYLDTMAGLEAAYPDMRFILMTGHSETGDARARLEAHNELIRSYARTNDMVLYDFHDIERYDPAGNPHLDTSDACDWCESWCQAHPADCPALGSDVPECAHSHRLNCYQKAKAFWWMMARLAGWDGTPAR